MDAYFDNVKENGLAQQRDKNIQKEVESQIQTLRQSKLAKLGA